MQVKFGRDRQAALEFSPALSAFQRQAIEDVARRDDFECFVTTDSGFADPAYGKGTSVTVLFYTTDGRLHAHRVGRRKVLHTVTSSADEAGQYRAAHLAEAFTHVARVNHYMVGVTADHTDVELCAAQQLLITEQNALPLEAVARHAVLDLALDLMEQANRSRRGRS